jgi:methionyl-tRNA formyltransferase
VTDSLRLVFAGTPDFAAVSLDAVLASRHRVVAAYTQPDRPAGRGQKLAVSPVKQRALAAGIPVLQPQTLKAPEARAELAALQPDLMVVVAYGLLLPKAVLELPRFGCVNVHGSVLPRWRGAAPIQRAIAAGDTETGVTIMQMDVGLDTGDMLHVLRTPIAADDTGGSVHDRLAVLGAQALVTVLDDLPRFLAAREKQDDGLATYAHKLKKEDGDIDWAQDTRRIIDLVRAFDPWPVAQTTHRGETLRVWSAVRDDAARGARPGTITGVARDGIRVSCGAQGEQGLRITRVQLPGKKAMPVADLLNGHADAFRVGEMLGSPADGNAGAGA